MKTKKCYLCDLKIIFTKDTSPLSNAIIKCKKCHKNCCAVGCSTDETNEHATDETDKRITLCLKCSNHPSYDKITKKKKKFTKKL